MSAIVDSLSKAQEFLISNQAIVTDSISTAATTVAKQIVEIALYCFLQMDQAYCTVCGWMRKFERVCYEGIASGIAFAIVPALVIYSAKGIQDIDQELDELIHASAIRQDQIQRVRIGHCNGIHLTHTLEQNPTRRTILYFPGNAEIWQKSFYFLLWLHKNAGVNVLCCNTRGVGDWNESLTFDVDLIEDGVTSVRHLLTQGIAPKDITLYGRSLGGAVAACAAAELVKEDISLHHINERSFKNLQAVIRSVVPVFGDCAALMAESFNWRLNAEKAFSSLRGHVVVLYNDRDELVRPSAAFRSVVERAPAHNAQKITTIEMNDAEYWGEGGQIEHNSHCRAFSSREQRELLAAIKSIWPEHLDMSGVEEASLT